MSANFFLDCKNFDPISDQWDYLGKIKKISITRLDKLYKEIIKDKIPDNLNISETKKIYKAGKLEVTIKNQIILSKNQITKELANFLRSNLNFVNSEYIIKQKIGRSVYGVQKFFKLINETKEYVMLPRESLTKLLDFCNENKIDYKILDGRKKLENIKFNSKIKLKDEQQKVIDICEHKQEGIIVAPPGFGKTILGVELIIL